LGKQKKALIKQRIYRFMVTFNFYRTAMIFNSESIIVLGLNDSIGLNQ